MRKCMKTMPGRSLSVAVLLFLSLLVPRALAAAPQVMIGLGHSDSVWDLAFSPDGRYIVSASTDGSAMLWDLASGREIRAFVSDLCDDGTRPIPLCAIFSPDGSEILTGATDGKIRVWDIVTGRELGTFVGHSKSIHSLSLSGDGRLLLSIADDRTLRLWDRGTKRELKRIEAAFNGYGCPAAIAPDGRMAVTGYEKNTAMLWDLLTGKAIGPLVGHSKNVESVAFSPDGKRILTGSYDKTARIWDRSTRMEVKILEGPSDLITEVAYSPDGRLIVSGDNAGSIRLWDASDGSPLGQFTVGTSGINALVFSSDGRWLLHASDEPAFGLWDLLLGEELRAFGARGEVPDAPRFPEDGSSLVFETTDDVTTTWDFHQGKPLGRWQNDRGPIRDLSFSRDNRRALSVGENGATVWDVAAWRGVGTISLDPSLIDGATISPDGRKALILGEDGRLTLWDLDGRKAIRVLEGGMNGSLVLQITSDGRSAIGLNCENSLTQWDLETGRKIRDFNVFSHAATLSPDGRTVLAENIQMNPFEFQIKLFDVRSGAELQRLVGHDHIACALAFSPDGRLALSGSCDWSVKLWDLGTGTVLQTMVGHSDTVVHVGFSPDGRRAVSTSNDSTMRIWDLESGKELAASIVHPGGEWLTWTPDAYFSGTPAAMKSLVYLVDGLEILEIDRVFETLYRPDIIAARLSGNAKATVGSIALIAPPPDAVLELERVDGSVRGISVERSDAAYRIVDGTVLARVRGVDKGGGLRSLRLYVNGKSVGEAGTPDGRGELVVRISLVDGNNTLRAVAYSSTMVESEPSEASIRYSTPVRQEPTLWVLAVGINRYKNPRYDLNYAVGDVESFLESLAGPASRLFGEVKTRKVLDGEATREGLREAFSGITALARPEDVFIFFYAGHGVALDGPQPGDCDFHFVLHDQTQMTSAESLAAGGLSAAEFRALTSAVKAQKQLLILDACNSGALSQAFTRRGAAEEIALARLSRSTGNVLVAASQSTQFAQEFPALGHGALTQALIDGLSGEAADRNGQISATGLKSWVESSLPLLTKRYAGVEQYPTGFVFGQDFPIGLRADSAHPEP